MDIVIMKLYRILLLSLFLISSFAMADTLPLDNFIKHDDYLDLKISPDGKHLVARVRHESSVVLLFIRRSDNKKVGGIKPDNDDEIHSVHWVNNNRVVYQLAEKQHYLDRPVPTGELFAVNVDNSSPELIYGYRASDSKLGSRISTKKSSYASQEILSVLENDKDHILIIEYPWEQVGNYWYDYRSTPPIISKLNVYTGRKKEIEIIPYKGAQALADKNGQVKFISWNDKKGNYHAAFRNSMQDEWQELTTAFNFDSNPIPVDIDAASSHAYLIATFGEKQLRTLLELELSSGKYRPLFTELKTDLVSWETDIETLRPVIGISRPDSAKYYYSNEDNRTARKHKILIKAFKGQDVYITSSTQDGKISIVHVTSDVNPGEYYVLNTETGKADFYRANRLWIDPRQMQPMNKVELTTRDGVTLRGFLTVPESKFKNGETVKPPLVVLPHGGPHGERDYWAFNSEVQLLANRGYAVLQINFRGSGGYGEVFEKSGYREWGRKMIEDIIDATKWTVDQGHVDANRICIYGASYGGYAALMAAARAPELYQCTVGYMGVYDLNYLYSKGDILEYWGGEGYLEKVIGRNQLQLNQFSPINHADKIKAAVMLIHGKNDRRVPVVHAEAMRDKLKQAGKDVSWLLYGQSGHGVWDLEYRRELYTELLKFLEKHIGN